jgi:hypothetical protein
MQTGDGRAAGSSDWVESGVYLSKAFEPKKAQAGGEIAVFGLS